MANAALRPPEFENYSVQRVLGEGGMGVVFLGHDIRADLPVAIKVMSKRMHDPDLQRRFLQENEILSALNHRNIVRCFEIVRTREGVPSIIMEYLDGVDFRAFEGMPYPELLPLMMQAAMGLKYLKRKSVLHRDLSSNNIMVILENQKRLVKILDFGVAKLLTVGTTGRESQTQTGQFLGKFSFASPELFSSLKVDWQSDVYSLGVIFHRMLTGKYPIRTERTGNYYEWVVAHQQPREFPMRPPAGLPEVPEPLKDIVRRMLARDPRDRPQSYDEVIDRFDFLQRGASEAGLEPDSTTVSNLPLPVVEQAVSGSSGIPPPNPDVHEPPVEIAWEAEAPPEPADETSSGSGTEQALGVDAPEPYEPKAIAVDPPVPAMPRTSRKPETTPGGASPREVSARGRSVAPMRPSPGGRIVYGYVKSASEEAQRVSPDSASYRTTSFHPVTHRTSPVTIVLVVLGILLAFGALLWLLYRLVLPPERSAHRIESKTSEPSRPFGTLLLIRHS
ncbi:MAG: protein kinase [Thermoanaerobaculia bacterium]